MGQIPAALSAISVVTGDNGSAAFKVHVRFHTEDGLLVGWCLL